MKKHRKANDKPLQFRAASFEIRAAEGDKPAEVVASISSEDTCRTWCRMGKQDLMAYEILDHSEGSVDRSRMKDGLVIQDNHGGDQVGIMEVPIIKDKKLSGVIRFGSGVRSQEIAKDAANGIRKNMSVGYIVDPASYKQEGMRDGIPILRAMRWTPYEGSFVNVPADTTVGVNREASATQITINAKEKHTMTPEEIAAKAAQERALADAKKAGADEAIHARNEIDAIAKQFKLPEDKIREFTKDGLNVEKFRKSVMDFIVTNPSRRDTSSVELVPNMEKTEKRQYSIRNLIVHASEKALGNPSSVDAGFELEVAAELSKTTKRQFRGIPIPLGMRTALSVTSSSAATVQTSVLAAEWIDALRARLVLNKLGVRIMSGLIGDVALPKLTAKGTMYWVDTEGNAPTESAQTLGQVGGTPHIGGTFRDLTWKLLRQSTPDAESFIREDIMQVIARGIDGIPFTGSGAAGQPAGLKTISGIGNPTVDGTTPTWAQIRSFLGTIDAANANISGNVAYVGHPLVGAKLASTPKASTYPLFILDESEKGAFIGRCPYYDTTGVGALHLFAGDFSQLIMGIWDAADMLVDPYTLSSSGGVRIRILTGVDVMVRNGESFCYNAAMPV